LGKWCFYLSNYSDVLEHRRIPDELLGPTFYPLHANHVRALELRFGAEVSAGRTPFKIAVIGGGQDDLASLCLMVYTSVRAYNDQTRR
jgi:hypothetical protein